MKQLFLRKTESGKGRKRKLGPSRDGGLAPENKRFGGVKSHQWAKRKL